MPRFFGDPLEESELFECNHELSIMQLFPISGIRRSHARAHRRLADDYSAWNLKIERVAYGMRMEMKDQIQIFAQHDC